MANDFLQGLLGYGRRNRLFESQPIEVDEKLMQPITPRAPAAPQNVIGQQYQKHVMSMPQKKDPSLLRKIAAAAVAGLSNMNNPGNVMQDYENLAHPGYMGQLQDWEMRRQALREAALDEDRNNTNQRITDKDREAADLRRENQDLKTRAQEFKEKDAERKAELAKEKLELDRWKAQNPEGRGYVDEEGFVNLVNPRNGTVIKTKIQTGDLTDLEKANLQLQNQMTMEEQRQGNRLDLEGVRQGNRVNLEGMRQEGRENLNDARQESINQRQEDRQDFTINRDSTLENNRRTRPAPAKAAKPPAKPKKGDKYKFPTGIEAIFDGEDWIPVEDKK